MFKNYFSPDNRGARFFHYGIFLILALLTINSVRIIANDHTKRKMRQVAIDMSVDYLTERGYTRVIFNECIEKATDNRVTCPKIP